MDCLPPTQTINPWTSSCGCPRLHILLTPSYLVYLEEMSSIFHVRARHITVPCQPYSAFVSSTLSPGPDNRTFCFFRNDFNAHTKFHCFNELPSYVTFIKILAMYLFPRFHRIKSSWYSLDKRLHGLTSKDMGEFVTSEHHPKSTLDTPWIRSSFKPTRPL